MALVDQSLRQGRGDRRRRAALPAARHDPGVRRGAARGRRRGRRASGRATATGSSRWSSEAAAELSGADQRRWLDRLELEHDDIRAVLDRAVAAPDPPVAIGVAFSMWRFWQKHGHLAEARRRLEAMAAAPWSHDDPRLRARLMEALGGTCWWQGDLAAMGQRYAEALAIWQSIGDEAEIANAYYNASFPYAVARTPTQGRDATRTRTGSACAISRRARDIYHRIGDERGEANALWGIGNYHYFHELAGQRRRGVPRGARACSATVGDRTMEAWALHMLGTALLRNGDVAEAREHVDARDPPFPRRRRRRRD